MSTIELICLCSCGVPRLRHSPGNEFIRIIYSFRIFVFAIYFPLNNSELVNDFRTSCVVASFSHTIKKNVVIDSVSEWKNDEMREIFWQSLACFLHRASYVRVCWFCRQNYSKYFRFIHSTCKVLKSLTFN